MITLKYVKLILLLILVILISSCSKLETDSLAQDAKDSGTLFGYQIEMSNNTYNVIGFGQTQKDGSFIIHDISEKVWTFPPKIKIEKKDVTYEFFVNRTRHNK